MTLVAAAGPLAAYALVFQTVVYLMLPPSSRVRWVPLYTAATGTAMVVLAIALFGPARLGLGPPRLPEAVLPAAAGVVASLLFAGALLAHPGWRRTLIDPRVAGMSGQETFFQIAVRIPLLTALVEEAVFRGVLHAALTALYPAETAFWAGAVLFGLWHVGPGLDRASSSGQTAARSALATLLTVAATTGGGAVLLWLRLETGSIWASVAVHASVNMAMATASRIASAPHGRAIPRSAEGR